MGCCGLGWVLGSNWMGSGSMREREKEDTGLLSFQRKLI